MINFRYHLVSLTAVFLALTVGLILGTAALNGPAMEALETTSQGLRDSNEQLRAQVQELEDQLGEEQEFAAEIAPAYLAGKLTGKNILVVALPGADTAAVDGTVEMLGYAGATVSGRLSVLDDFFDPNNADQLVDLVDTTTPATVQTPVTYDGVQAMSYVLAAVTTGKAAGTAVEITPGDITKVTTALTDMSMLTVETTPTGLADGVIVLAGAGATDSDADQRNTGMVTITNEYAADGPTLYGAMTSTGDGNPINVLRTDSAETVATVDNVAFTQGQIATVAALAEFVNAGTVDHLGIGEGASALLPDAA
ncbi:MULTISPECIES: copper transporter [Glycomyces]|uniref:Copper transport outer membrane protein MctB n=1 Tax=Glycomyces artemisiae TaxID=1076443 RepID=A0A2T0UGZ8_9ACTN|nr:copper transporter [Glycomyces artemisiae]NUQ88286.1 copper transporter [Glycomyces artemisiae]PRY57215.1 copper transport outer membrane protein MctB [Glycomyces artemisiae]